MKTVVIGLSKVSMQIGIYIFAVISISILSISSPDRRNQTDSKLLLQPTPTRQKRHFLPPRGRLNSAGSPQDNPLTPRAITFQVMVNRCAYTCTYMSDARSKFRKVVCFLRLRVGPLIDSPIDVSPVPFRYINELEGRGGEGKAGSEERKWWDKRKAAKKEARRRA